MKRAFLAVLLLVAASGVNALELDGAKSQLKVTSIKNDRVAELFSFSEVSGSLNEESGEALIIVALNSIDSGIDIRDQRMKKYLFNTDRYKTAEFRARVDVQALKSLTPGEPRSMRLSGELSISGKTLPIHFATQVTKLSGGAISVVTVEPAFIDSNAVEMAPGIEKLRSLAGLKNINLSVPVTFAVQFH